MLAQLAFVGAGFAFLLLGGEALVRGAIAVAARMGLSPMVVGVVLVGFGTSMPELATSLRAALAGSPGIAVGNVVGSNSANVLLILGLAAVAAPLAVSRAELARDGGAMIAATAIGIVAMLTGGALGRPEGALMIGGLALYMVHALRSGGGAPVAAGAGRLWAGLALSLAGLAGVLLGADLLVRGAVELAEAAGLSEAAIGATVVAVGTSLPELAAALVASRHGQGAMALGNVLGSNVFNILGILGITALLAPLEVPPSMLSFDIWVMAGAALALVAMAVTGWRITRAEGAALLAAYAGYVALALG